MAKTKLLIAAAECVPFAKAGGLADVTGTLPRELAALGFDVRVILPFHKVTKDKYAGQTRHLVNFSIDLGRRGMYVGIEQLEMDGVTFYFVDNEDCFGWQMYKGGDAEIEQYAFFSRAVLECLPFIDFMPDALLANDWHTAILPMLIKTQYAGQAQGEIKTALAIHNLMYQGKTGFGLIKELLGIDDGFYTPEFIELYGCANILKAGLVFADRLITVSPTYAGEIMHEYYAEGLQGILNARKNDLTGILNGIDTECYDPRTDARIKARFDIDELEGKFIDRAALAEEYGLRLKDSTAVIAMVTRLTEQKGLDLVCTVFDSMMRQNVAFVLLGSGDKRYCDAFSYFAGKYPGKVGVYIGYDETRAHAVYAGADLFLMPSKFEPCGISQMIALRYGTLPIVRETGGLKDTVQPYNKYTGEGNGFSFENYNAHDMLYTISYSLRVMKDTVTRARLMRNAMSGDFSFAASAKKYAKVFDELTSKGEKTNE